MSSMIDPDVMALFSERTQRLFGASRRRYIPRDREEISRKLAACKRPAFDAVLEFEEYFGGLIVGQQKQTLELGVSFTKSEPDPEDPEDPERTMVPIGQFPSSPIMLLMDARGEVVSYFERIWARSSSIFSYLEQYALGVEERWPLPRFSGSVRPAMGARLAEALKLGRDDGACDAYELWWESDDITLHETSFSSSEKSGLTYIYTGSLASIVKVMRAAALHDADVRIRVSAEPMKTTKWTKKQQRASSHTIDSWGRESGATRYAYAQEGDDVGGTVWIIAHDGRLQIQQYRLDQGRLIGWDSYTPDGGISRDVE